MRFILFISNFLLFFFLICEDLKRPKIREDCFERTFIGEYNESNSYCCFFHFIKFGSKHLKCSVHFKNEIDNNKVNNTIELLKKVNTQTGSKDEINIISFDCKKDYIKITNKYIFLFIIIILI